MTGLPQAFDPPPWATLSKASRVLLAATAALLFLSPAAGSAGLRGAMLLLAVIALVLARGRHLGHDLARMPRALAIPIAAWCALCVASLAWSEVPRHSLSELRVELLYGISAFITFFAAAMMLGRWRWWWAALMAGSLLVLVLQAVQEFSPLRFSRHPMDGAPGFWSTHLVLLAPLLLAIVWPRPWGFDQRAPVKAVALLLLLVSAAGTANRIVWAALAVQLLVVLAVSGLMPAMEATRVASLRRLTALAAIAVALGFTASVLERNARHFGSDPSVTASIDQDLRPRLWAVAWNEFRKAPLLGHGYGREVLEARFLPVTPRPDHPPMRHAHNTFADVALQTGGLGLAIFLAIWMALGLEYRRYLRDARLAPLGIIGLALLAGYAVKNLTDDFFYRHNALLFWCLNGMLLGLGRAAGAEREPKG